MIGNQSNDAKRTDDETDARDESLDSGARSAAGGLDPAQFPSFNTLDEFMEALRKRREGRNYTPRTREEIDESMREIRDGWNDRP